MTHFNVVVGNIGTVYNGYNRREAEECMDEYIRHSKSGYGRAAGEDVTIFENGEPVTEFQGSIAKSKEVD